MTKGSQVYTQVSLSIGSETCVKKNYSHIRCNFFFNLQRFKRYSTVKYVGVGGNLTPSSPIAYVRRPNSIACQRVKKQ